MKKAIVIGVAVCVGVIAVGVWRHAASSSGSDGQRMACASSPTAAGMSATTGRGALPEPAAVSSREAALRTAGTQNPPATHDGKAPALTEQAAADPKVKSLLLKDGGHAESVKGDVNPQAASIREALKTGKHPERISMMFPPKEPFDRAKFEADPEAYLGVVEPGRVFQSAAPGKDVPVLAAQAPLFRKAHSGEKVTLAVKTGALGPVTFTATDLGLFEEDGLGSVTVRADQDGMAKVTFVGGQGAVNECRILASSPVASGQIRFVVDIENPPVTVAKEPMNGISR